MRRRGSIDTKNERGKSLETRLQVKEKNGIKRGIIKNFMINIKGGNKQINKTEGDLTLERVPQNG